MSGEISPLGGRIALVTGSSRNLGASIARQLASEGARVAVTFRDSARDAEVLVAELVRQTNLAHIAVECDLESTAGVRAATTEVFERMGGSIDILVNNLGGWAGDSLVSLPESDWDMVMNTNVKAALVASQAVGPKMSTSGWGRIVNISAASAYVRNHSVYGLAKAALEFLTEELAVELAPHVTVNAIAPGQIAESAAEAEVIEPGFAEKASSQTPAGRLVTRREVAALVGELCSDRFALVTGATIPIDGGWRFHRP